jgi:peptidoglycan/LPS O-acetylase OafA/YrhL
MPNWDSRDALRGLAALAVVLWHWRHFYFSGTELVRFDPSRQPLYRLLRPLYLDGFQAVNLFCTVRH